MNCEVLCVWSVCMVVLCNSVTSNVLAIKYQVSARPYLNNRIWCVLMICRMMFILGRDVHLILWGLAWLVSLMV